MRFIFRLLGNGLILASLVLGAFLMATAWPAEESTQTAVAVAEVMPVLTVSPDSTVVHNAPAARVTATPLPRMPITRVRMESIQLDAEVVPSRVVRNEQGLTWAVPAFKAGHAEQTAGAGQLGNGVLFGHVESLRSGDVFSRLSEVKIDAPILVNSGEKSFVYHVVEVRVVPRDDTSVVQPTGDASITLVTCAGTWNPLTGDFTERLVVRGVLTDAG